MDCLEGQHKMAGNLKKLEQEYIKVASSSLAKGKPCAKVVNIICLSCLMTTALCCTVPHTIHVHALQLRLKNS